MCCRWQATLWTAATRGSRKSGCVRSRRWLTYRLPSRTPPNHVVGDDDLEHVLSAGALVAALDSTFRIIEACLPQIDLWD